jgi:hypothetical protein
MTKTFAFLTVLTLAGAPAALLAQPRPAEEQNAAETRERLNQVLQQYPPTVRQVLRFDPTLLGREDYMGTYPALAAFIAQHPEVAHNPAFFLGGSGGAPFTDARTQVANSIESIFIGLEVMTGVIFGIGTLGWLIRSGIDYRRWIRATKIQTDAHAKIVDRLASNEDLLAYIQSPAGQRFLTATVGGAPAGVDQIAAPVSAPVNRILWSVQVGVVLAVAGAGLWLAKNGIIEEVAQAMQVFSLLVMALGLGFVLSAFAAYALSRQLGLVGSHPDHA